MRGIHPIRAMVSTALASVTVLLALDRGQLVGAALVLATMDALLGAGIGGSRIPRLLAIRYGVVGPVALAFVALGGAPGEAVVLASTWLLQCILALGPSRVLVPLLAGTALLALAPRPLPEPAERGFRVGTFNLEWGRSGPDALAATLRGLDADVVAIQEVVDARHWLGVDLLAELRRRTGLHALAVVEPHPTHGSFGTGILSRHELHDPGSLLLPLAPGSGARRVAVKASIFVRGRRVTVVSAHLDRPPHASIAENLLQARAVADWIRDDAPVVLCGDFNALPVYPSHRLLSARFRPVRPAQRWPSGTWPAPLGLVRLDWIFVRDLEPLSQRTIRSSPSDHFPVVADLAFLPTERAPR